MRLAVLASLILLTACAATPAASGPVDIAEDPAWTPPGEELSVKDAPPPVGVRTIKPRSVQQPNHREVQRLGLRASN